MLGIFRGFLQSRVGVIVTFIVLGVIALAFGLADINGSLRSSRSSDSDTLVTVGSETIPAEEYKADTQRLFQQYSQRGMTMDQFIAQGGFDQPLAQRTSILAIAQLAGNMGMRVGKNLVDSEIAQAFPGIDGKFDKSRYTDYLNQQGKTDAQLHAEVARDLLSKLLIGQLTPQAMGTPPVAAGLATPYASMLLEKRTGTVAFLSTRAIPAGAPVTDAEAKDYYGKNVARYTTPERRVVRYVDVTAADVRAKSAPSDAEVAQAYTRAKDKYAPSETRDIRQVVVADRAGADALAAKVRGGAPIDVAAKAIGLDAATLNGQKKADYAAQSSTAIADQAFAAQPGAVIGPVQSSLGWAVVRVEKVNQLPGKTLDQAKPELVKALTDQKAAVAINDLHAKIDDMVSRSTPIEDIARQLGLPLLTTPALDAQGADPAAVPAPAKPDEKLAFLAAAGFSATPDDDPKMVQSSRDGGFVLFKLDKVVAAAPRPLPQVIDQVRKDLIVDRQVRQGRTVAQGVTDKVNKGMPLAQALAETGLKLDGTKPLTANRAQLVTAQRRGVPVPPQFALLFNSPLHRAKLLQAPYKGGWFVIVVDSIERGDSRSQPKLIDQQRADMAQSLGIEYQLQFAHAARNQVGVKRNDAAIGKLRASLTGAAGDAAEQ